MYVFLRIGSQIICWVLGTCDLSPIFEVPDKQNCIFRSRRLMTGGKRRNWHDTNEPRHRGDLRNRCLRMSRTEPRSKCRLVPDRPNRCCKVSLLGCQGEQGVQTESAIMRRHSTRALKARARAASTRTTTLSKLFKLNLTLNDT